MGTSGPERTRCESSVIAVVARLVSAPGAEDEVARLLLGYSERVRDEPGNILFAPRVSTADPREFWVYEEYADAASFRRHLDSPHNGEFNAAVAPHLRDGGPEVLELAELIDGSQHG